MESQINNSFSDDSRYEPLSEKLIYHGEDNSVPLSLISAEKEKEMIAGAELAHQISKDLEKCNGELIKLNSKSKAMQILDKSISVSKKLELGAEKGKGLGKAKAWQLTLNECPKYDALKNYLMGLKTLRYFISCKEIAPSTGHPHIHIYCQFTVPISLSFKKCCGAHLERCYGSPEQNQAYIMKDGDILDEWGDLGSNVNTQFPTIAEVKRMTDEQMDECPLQYFNQIQKIRKERANNMDINNLAKQVQIFYLWGPSGCGKTSYAKLAIHKLNKPFNQVKYEGGFWSGLNEDCEIALYDDWRDSDMKPNEFIKFIDYNRHSMNVKYGQCRNNYKYIFITSIQDPQKIYWESSKKNEEQVKQWIRRMKIINVYEEYGVEEIVEKYKAIFGDFKEPDFDINNII